MNGTRPRLAPLVLLTTLAACPPDPPVAPRGDATTSPTAAQSSGAAAPAAPKGPDARLVAQWCARPMPRVQALSDASGQVGGYAVSENVRDSPIHYFDARGNARGTFHIYGNPQTEEVSPGAVAELQAAFPKSTLIDCSPPPSHTASDTDVDARFLPLQAHCKVDADCVVPGYDVGTRHTCCAPCPGVAGTRAWGEQVASTCQKLANAGQVGPCPPIDCAAGDARCSNGHCTTR